jgi:hypothetical protein
LVLSKFFFVQRLDRDGGRRRRKDHPDRQRGLNPDPDGRGQARGNQGRQDDLGATCSHDWAAKAPKQIWAKLKPNQEQHHDDAELGDVHHAASALTY